MSTAEPERSTAPAGAKEPARRRGFRFAVATFFLIALISAVTQLCILGSSLWFLLDAGPELWPSGGFVALVSGVAMWIWCPNWASWRKWVWLPVVVAVIVAVVTVYLVGMGHTLDADQRIPRICARLDNRLTELEQQRVDLLARVEARAEVLSRQRQASGSHLVDPWINSFGEDAQVRDEMEELETRYEELVTEYDATCGTWQTFRIRPSAPYGSSLDSIHD